MLQNATRSVTARDGTDLGNVQCHHSFDIAEYKALALSHQHELAAERLARQYRLTLPVARATAELAGIGGAHG